MRYKMISIWNHHCFSGLKHVPGCFQTLTFKQSILKTQRSHWSSPDPRVHLQLFSPCRVWKPRYLPEPRRRCCESVRDHTLFFWTNREFIDFLKMTNLKLWCLMFGVPASAGLWCHCVSFATTPLISCKCSGWSQLPSSGQSYVGGFGGCQWEANSTGSAVFLQLYHLLTYCATKDGSDKKKGKAVDEVSSLQGIYD